MGWNSSLAEDGAIRLALGLESRSPQILEKCRLELVSIGNTVAQSPESVEQMMDHCRQILGDVAGSLRAGAVLVDDSHRLITLKIGTARAAAGIHPGESLQAGSTFFDTVLAEASELLVDEPAALEVFNLAAQALGTSVMQRVQEAFAFYTSFLLSKVHEAQIDERRRIARELHDRIGHCISVAHHQLQLHGMYQETDVAKAEEKLAIAHNAVRDAMGNLREVATGLRSPKPHHGLAQALVNDLAGVDTGDIDIRIRVNGDESWVDAHVLDECRLIMREAARNAVRHGQPSNLIINVDITPQEVRAMVEDDGCGFDTAATPASLGMGVGSMRERAALLGGVVFVRSKEGKGTQVGLIAPPGRGRQR